MQCNNIDHFAGPTRVWDFPLKHFSAQYSYSSPLGLPTDTEYQQNPVTAEE
eukprot:COSAG01_NODE_83_length_27807_cov_20.014581_5_plen_51_part_00